MVFPVVLSTGKRLLFGETSEKKRLRLAESKAVGDGHHPRLPVLTTAARS
jgi:hypothetical protein